MNTKVRIKNGTLPDVPGVYIMKDDSGRILYVGKAANLKRRVSSYFERPHDSRIQKLVSEIGEIDYEETDTAIEALIKEAELIKKLVPPYNIKEKDDKSFLSVVITRERFPRVILARSKDIPEHSARFGPFTSATSIREALRIMRRIFPWSDHVSESTGKSKRCCFNYQIGLCPGTCCGMADLKEYRNNIKNLTLFFEGKKKRIVQSLSREMSSASKQLDFERAEKVRRQIFSLQHIQDVALVKDDSFDLERGAKEKMPVRIEGYDISNISGDSAVGSMVVFENNKPNKNEYRKFKIRTVAGPDDTGMLREVLQRRFRHPEWRRPDIILVDGGAPQVGAVRGVLKELSLRIPVIGIAKGPERKRNDIIGLIPPSIDKVTLIRVRDEAHRFAVSYHKRVRSRKFLHDGEEE